MFDELAAKGFAIAPAELDENVTTRGVDLLALPRGTRLRLGRGAVVEMAGLRAPCAQIERHRPGLLAAVLDRTPDVELVRKAGLMVIVLAGGTVRLVDAGGIGPPPLLYERLERV